MDIHKYLQQKEVTFERNAKRFRDLQIFDFNYIPEQPLMRQELKPVIDALVRYEQTGIANNLLIVGSRGCGKTVSVRYLQNIFAERDMTVLYANCRTHNSSYRILASLLGVRARGVSFAELAERFADAWPERTVVILDEVDLLSDKDKRKDIFYFLSRAQGNYMTILLSNSPRWASTLDESIQSTLQPESIYFRPYTPAELARILEQRVEAGLRNVPRMVLQKIAALTAKYTNSDVRVALKTLYYWATEPEASLDDNFQRARRDIVVNVVGNLNDKSLLILKAAMGAEETVKAVYARYRQLCARYREEPFSYVYFYSTLSYLQSIGLIALASTKVRRTYTKLIQLTFPEDVLDAVWRLRFT